MFENILSLIKTSSVKILPKWERVDTDIDDMHLPLIMRFLNNELPEVGCVVLLEDILRMFSYEIKELLYIQDNFARCTYLMEPKKRLFMEQRLDSIRSQSFFTNTFFKGNSSITATKESVIPVFKRDPLASLPLQPYKKNLWLDQKAVRVWHYDSMQLITDLSSDPRPRFLIPPKVGIVTVDLMVLVMQLVNWIDTIEWDGVTPIDFRNFMRDQVFVNVFDDLKAVWMKNVIYALLNCENIVQASQLAKTLKQERYTRMDFTGAFVELYSAFADMKRGAIPVEAMLAAKLFGQKSIMDRFEEAINELRPRSLRQYDHLTLSIYISELNLIATMLQYSKNSSLQRSVGVEIERRINLLIRARVHKQYRQIDLSNWLQTELNKLLMIAQNMK